MLCGDLDLQSVLWPGPKAIASRLGIALDHVPGHDPHDEICGDPKVTQAMILKYGTELGKLSMMGFNDQNKNLRHLMRMKGVDQIIEAYFQPSTFEVCHSVFTEYRAYTL